MNLKILIIYPYINQEPLVYHMVMNLRKNDINVDAFNSSNFKFTAPPIIKVSFRIKILGFLSCLPIHRLQGLLFRIIDRNGEIVKIAENYDLIDFHVFHNQYDAVINNFLDKKIVKITNWGSDFYRADNSRREQQRRIYNKCNCIQLVTKAMKTDFLEYYHDFENKIKIANFGVFQFDLIDKVINRTYLSRFKNKKTNGKLLVLCGHNGSKGQQHKTIIQALNSLNQLTKNRIYLVFPMTYGSEKKYLKEIELELEKTNIPFMLLKDYLSDNEIAKLRLEMDLVINIQITDAFSGSLQEHLYAGNLLLVGDWLPYSLLDENQVFYKKCNLENLSNQIFDCIENFDLYKKMTVGNREKMYNISSWNVAGKRMSNIYKELQK